MQIVQQLHARLAKDETGRYVEKTNQLSTNTPHLFLAKVEEMGSSHAHSLTCNRLALTLTHSQKSRLRVLHIKRHHSCIGLCQSKSLTDTVYEMIIRL